MKILADNNYSFKANLFYKDKMLNKDINEKNNSDKYGAKNTDIFVSKIDSVYNGKEYENKVSFQLISPIFGEFNFNNIKCRNTKTCVSESGQDALFLNKTFFDDGLAVKSEDKALGINLLSKVNKAATYNDENPLSIPMLTNAVSILSFASDKEKYNDVLSSERLNQCYKIARKVNNDVLLAGSGLLLDKNA